MSLCVEHFCCSPSTQLLSRLVRLLLVQNWGIQLGDPPIQTLSLISRFSGTVFRLCMPKTLQNFHVSDCGYCVSCMCDSYACSVCVFSCIRVVSFIQTCYVRSTASLIRGSFVIEQRKRICLKLLN